MLCQSLYLFPFFFCLSIGCKSFLWWKPYQPLKCVIRCPFSPTPPPQPYTLLVESFYRVGHNLWVDGGKNTRQRKGRRMLHNWANCYTNVEKNAGLISFTVGFALRRSKLVQETHATLSADKVEKRKKNHRDSVARVFLHSKHCACRSFSSVLSASWAVYFCCDCSYRIFSFNSICTNLIKKALLREKGVDNSYFNRHAVEIRGGRSCCLGSIRNCVCTCFTYYDFGCWNT